VPADLGKVLLHPSFGEEPQWAVVGDTYPLGCAFDESIVHCEFFKENPDFYNSKYNTKYGVYSENCGLDNVIVSWGHDEYMHMVAKMNNTTLPPEALFIIRFHSFYALHRAGAYTHLMNEEDKEMLEWVKIFNKYDLYSKSKVRIDVEAVKPYYQSLIDKYFPSKLRWWLHLFQTEMVIIDSYGYSVGLDGLNKDIIGVIRAWYTLVIQWIGLDFY